jgi:hypothetical protein
MVIYLLDLFDVAVFAVSGVLTAGRKSMDLFGVVVGAVITTIGGGTARDVLLDNRPNFWIEDATYLLVTLGAAGATLVYGRFFTPPRDLLLVATPSGSSSSLLSGRGRPTRPGRGTSSRSSDLLLLHHQPLTSVVQSS